ATPLRLVETVAAGNDQRKRAMGRKVAAALRGQKRGKSIGGLGVTVKPNTHDKRQTPPIAPLTPPPDKGASERAHDPAGMEQARALLGDVTYCDDAYACAEGADALVIVTEWEQFRALDLARLKQVMARPVVVDLRNIYRPDELARHGFSYVGVGRPGI